MQYNDITKRYFAQAPLAGSLDGAMVLRGSSGQRETGTWVQFDIRTSAGVVQSARFLAFGCPHTIAVAAWVTEQSQGRPLVSRLPEDVHALRARFAVPLEKLGRLLIIEDAWIAAAHGG